MKRLLKLLILLGVLSGTLYGKDYTEKIKFHGKKGNKYFKAQKFDEAIAEYTKALEFIQEKNQVNFEAKLYFNIGRSYQFKHDFINAYIFVLKADRKIQDPLMKGQIVKTLNQIIIKLRKTHSFVQVQVDPSESKLIIDEIESQGPKPWVGWLEPGKHVLRMSSEGFITQQKSVTVEAGKNYEFSYQLQKQLASLVKKKIKPGDGKIDGTTPKSSSSSFDIHKAGAWTGIGVGVALMAAAGIFYLSAGKEVTGVNEATSTYGAGKITYGDYVTQYNSYRTSYLEKMDLFNVFMISGGAMTALAIGYTIYVYSTDDAPAKKKTTFYVTPAPGGGMVTFGVTF